MRIEHWASHNSSSHCPKPRMVLRLTSGTSIVGDLVPDSTWGMGCRRMFVLLAVLVCSLQLSIDRLDWEQFAENMCLLPFNGFVLSFAHVLSCYGLWRSYGISGATLGIRWLRILYRWWSRKCKIQGKTLPFQSKSPHTMWKRGIWCHICSYRVRTFRLMSIQTMPYHSGWNHPTPCQFKRPQSVSLYYKDLCVLSCCTLRRLLISSSDIPQYVVQVYCLLWFTRQFHCWFWLRTDG